MDIITLSSTREKEAPLGTDQGNDVSSPQTTNSSPQDSNDYWEQINSSEYRMRTVSCPSRPDNSTFGHLYSLYSPKKEEPNLSVQIANYNRKHDSWLELTLNQEVSCQCLLHIRGNIKCTVVWNFIWGCVNVVFVSCVVSITRSIIIPTAQGKSISQYSRNINPYIITWEDCCG